MTRKLLEKKILELWMQSRIPLTLAHLQYATDISRAQLDTWLDELVLEGTLDMSLNGDGDVVYAVKGAKRPKNGAQTFAELKSQKKPKASSSGSEIDLQNPLQIANKASKALTESPKEGEKSLLKSAGFSLLGPIGWLYAGSLKEAVPATAAAIAIAYLLPSFLLTPLLFVGLPASAVVGLLYGWQHNKHGKRMPLLLDEPKDKDDD